MDRANSRFEASPGFYGRPQTASPGSTASPFQSPGPPLQQGRAQPVPPISGPGLVPMASQTDLAGFQNPLSGQSKPPFLRGSRTLPVPPAHPDPYRLPSVLHADPAASDLGSFTCQKCGFPFLRKNRQASSLYSSFTQSHSPFSRRNRSLAVLPCPGSPRGRGCFFQVSLVSRGLRQTPTRGASPSPSNPMLPRAIQRHAAASDRPSRGASFQCRFGSRLRVSHSGLRFGPPLPCLIQRFSSLCRPCSPT